MRLFSATIVIGLAIFCTPTLEASGKELRPTQILEEIRIDEATAHTVSLNSQAFVHRWSYGDKMHEFTPPGQEDLSSWQDMITMEYLPGIKNRQDLARLADKLLGFYQERGGKIVGSIALHTLDDPVTEHFIAVLLGTSEVIEFVQTRLQILDGIGTVTTYAHRIYAPHRANMAVWMPKNGPAREKALLRWQGTPSYGAMASITSKNGKVKP